MVPVTRDVAMYHQGTFHHIYMKNADGTPVRCRANGACKTWKRRPHDYRLPVKYGLRGHFYLIPTNCTDWEITEEDWNEVRRKLLCVKLKVEFTIPNGVLHDMAVDHGIDEEVATSICGG